MSRYRQLGREPLRGEPVPFKTVKQRRALIGREIEWSGREAFWKIAGLVEAVEGKNVLVSGEWKWAPDMLSVHVLPEPPE